MNAFCSLEEAASDSQGLGVGAQKSRSSEKAVFFVLMSPFQGC